MIRRAVAAGRWLAPVVVVAFALGLVGGYLRWGRRVAHMQQSLERVQQRARPPAVIPLADARPAAVVDLMSPDGTTLVNGQWRYADAVAPTQGWKTLAAGEVARRPTAAVPGSTAYRLQLTLPERVGDLDVRASSVLFEVVVDGFGEAWVDGKRSPVLGQNGSTLISAFRAPNRVLLTRDARPGQRFELTIAGVRGTPPGSATRGFSIRSATLDFVPPAPAIGSGVGEILRFDPGLDSIVPAGARIEKVAGGLISGEGPVWMPQGYLLFSDFAANLIYRWALDDGLSVFRTKSGYAGPDIAQYGLPGSNGLAVDHDGRLTIAEHGRRRVVRVEPDGDITVLAESYGGRRLNSPNDLVYKSDGALYFTDPPFGLPKVEKDPRRELPYSGVFRWTGGRLDLLTQELAGPNGLAFSPDERYLYVADWSTASIVRYDLEPDGTLGERRVIFEKGIDGIKVDQRGSLYLAGQGSVWVVAPDGRLLGGIKPPEWPANIAWGDDDRRTLYITAGTSIYRIRLSIPGAGTAAQR